MGVVTCMVNGSTSSAHYLSGRRGRAGRSLPRQSQAWERRRRGCHTAAGNTADLDRTLWFIEGDISDCFGSFSHDVLLGILTEKIRDNRFLRLIRNMFKAGYAENWQYHDTLSAVPQGGVVSRVLSNIYLHKLDEFAEKELIPAIHPRGAPEKEPRILSVFHPDPA
jgi:hypothetical protein